MFLNLLPLSLVGRGKEWGFVGRLFHGNEARHRPPPLTPRYKGEGDTAAKPKLLGRFVAALAVLFILALPAIADPTYPERTGPVVDAAHVLSDADRAALTRKVLDLEISTGVQLQIATVPSLDGQDIAPYANGLFRSWKIGQKGVDNGLLLLWAPKERQIRFEVGRGLEGTFTDLQSKLILHNTMVPKLKAGDGVGALTAGVDDAIQVLTKSKADLPERLRPERRSDLDGTTLFIIFFFVVFGLIFVLSIAQQFRRRGWSRSSGWGPGGFIGGAGGFSDSSSGGSWGSGSSDSGGGDFSGGGGGDSGGGGSSDSY